MTWGGIVRKKHEFALTPAQVILVCAEKKFRPICAGHVLALQFLLVVEDWSLDQAADKMDLGRTTLSDTLSLKSVPSGENLDRIADGFEIPLWVFDLWACVCLEAHSSE